jgi:hypothetical protein
MKRPLSRLRVDDSFKFGLILLIAVAASRGVETRAQEDASEDAANNTFIKELLSIERIEPGEDDDELLKLHKARHNAALNEVQACYEDLRQGNTTIHQLFNAGRRLLDSQLELATFSEEKIAALETALKITNQFEAILAAQLDNGYGSKRELARITYERLQVRDRKSTRLNSSH